MLSRSVFATDDERAVASLAESWVGAALGHPARALSCEFSVGAVIVLEQPGGARAVLKAWPGAHDRPMLDAQVRIQAALAEEGAPAPRVLAGLSPMGASLAMLMAFDRSGEAADVRTPGVRTAMARGFADLVLRSQRFLAEDALPDWRVRSDAPLWPKPHNVLFDFEATRHGAEWIDAIATRTRQRMKAARSPLVVAHGDWSAKNLRIGSGRIAVIYDWDSMARAPETFAVGSAAAHFPVTWELPVPETPAVGEMAAFIAEYEQARGRAFTREDREEIAAYATFSRAYKARCEHCGDPQREKWEGSSRQALEATGGYTARMLGG